MWRTPWYHGYNVIAVCLLFQALTLGLALTSFTFFAESWVAEFNVPRSEIAFAAVLASLACTLLGPIAGRALDMHSIRLLVASGLGIFALALFLVSFATASWHVLAIYGLLIPFGLSLGSAIPAQILAARWFPERQGFAIGLVLLGMPLGGVVMPPSVNALIAQVGWRSTMQIGAIAALVLVALVLLVVRNSPRDGMPAGSSAPPPVPGATGRDILTSRDFWLVAFVVVVITTAFSGLSYNLASYATERGLSLGTSAAILAILAVIGFGITVGCGYLSDRIAHRYLFAISAACTAIGFFGFAFAYGAVPVFAAVFFFGIGTGGLFVLMGASFARCFGAASLGRATGLAGIFIAFSSIGAPAVARLQEVTGSYEAPLLILAAAALITTAIAMLIRSGPHMAPRNAAVA